MGTWSGGGLKHQKSFKNSGTWVFRAWKGGFIVALVVFLVVF